MYSRWPRAATDRIWDAWFVFCRRAEQAHGKKKQKKTYVRGADDTDFAFTTLRLSRTCLLRLYFRSVALSISIQSLSSSILLFIAMFTFCLTLARNHQDGRIWAPFRRGYSSGFTVAFQLHQHFGFLMGFHEALSRTFVLSAAMRLSQ